MTHVIIPVQKGGPNYCYALNEEEVFFMEEELGLLTLGWIQIDFTDDELVFQVHCPDLCQQSQQILVD